MAYPTNPGWFQPSNSSNLYNPGSYTKLMYKAGFLGGLIGVIPSVIKNLLTDRTARAMA